MRARLAILLLFCIGCGAAASAPAAKVEAPKKQKPVIHTSPLPGNEDRDCKPDIEVSKTTKARTSACEVGDLHACRALLAEDRPAEPLAEKARETLHDGCKSDPVCGCALYGSALTFDRKERFDQRGLAYLDRACARGALAACDEILLIAELCSRDEDQRVLCRELRAAGLVHEREADHRAPPRLEDAKLPSVLEDCFVVAKDMGADKCVAGRDVYFNEPSSICSIDPAACSTPEGERNAKKAPCPFHPPDLTAVYCFRADRVYFRSKQGSWSQWGTDWRAYPKDPSAKNPGEPTFYGREGLALRVDGREAILGDRYRLMRADDATRRAAQVVLRAPDACEHARACIDAILHGNEPHDAPPVELPASNESCANLEARHRNGVKGPLPAACR